MGLKSLFTEIGVIKILLTSGKNLPIASLLFVGCNIYHLVNRQDEWNVFPTWIVGHISCISKHVYTEWRKK